jgi:hypothetical protein
MRLFSPDSRKRLKKFWKLLFIAALLVAFELNPWGVLICPDNLPRMVEAGTKGGDKSDLNGDGVVDLDDLISYSQQKGLDWTNVDWCQWIEDNPNQEKNYAHLFDFIRDYFVCDTTVPILSNPTVSEINIPMVTLGATIVNDGGDPIFERGTVWNTTGPAITENQLAEGGTASGPFSHVRTDFTGVEIGTRIYFRGYAVNSVGIGYSPQESFVVEGPLAVKNANHRPTRLALGPNGNLYVSDAKVGSVFIYDANLQVTGEFKDLDSPVGVAVNSAGFIYIGNSRLGRVEKYNPQGQRIATIGEGMIRMPTDLTLDQAGNLFVADPDSNVVWVFKPDGTALKPIRKGDLKSPMAVEIAYDPNGSGQQELYVADKGNYLVKVFDLQGNLLRSFGGFPTKSGWFNPTWNYQGKFVSLQSLAVDAQGLLHAVDININKIQILDPVTGGYIAEYGEYGTGAGQIKLPLDIIINNAGDVIVANSDNKRVEVIYTVP